MWFCRNWAVPVSFPVLKALSQLLEVLLAESLQLSVPLGTASAAESCLAQGHAPSQVGIYPMMKGKKGLAKKGLAFLAQLRTDLKGHCNSRTAHGVS